MRTLSLILFLCFSWQGLSKEKLPTYFTYESIEQLATGCSDFSMDKDSLIFWDKELKKLGKTKGKAKISGNRIKAYLYTAQKEAAFLSYNAQGQFEGSLDPVSYEVLTLFYDKVSSPIHTDEYSVKLAKLVMEKLQARFEKEEQNIQDYSLKTDDKYWQKSKGKMAFGLNYGSLLPWFVSSNETFKASIPPNLDSPFWKHQAEIVKEMQTKITKEQKDRILYWAEGKGEGSGDWFYILNNYLFKNDISFEKILFVRAIFAEAYSDTTMTVYDSKYRYLVKRPSIVDPQLKTEIEVPNHPSYPSAHSATSGMAATLLSYYFPKDRALWYKTAMEAGYSRLWAGIHFPIDHQVGFCMGESIAEEVINLNK